MSHVAEQYAEQLTGWYSCDGLLTGVVCSFNHVLGGRVGTKHIRDCKKEKLVTNSPVNVK